MNRLLAGAALCLCTALVPHSVLADESAPDYRSAAIALPTITQPAPPRRNRFIRPILYSLQAFDAIQTAQALHKSGRYEQNGMLRPFTHGGAPTIMAAFAIGDIVRDRIFKRARPAHRDAIDATQALSNIEGIITTSHSMHGP
jgi:hypothetical protein